MPRYDYTVFTPRHQRPGSPRQVATPSEETMLRELRKATHVQWRFANGQFATYSGSKYEEDNLERKGLPIYRTFVNEDRVLAVKPEDAQAWLQSRHKHHTR